MDALTATDPQMVGRYRLLGRLGAGGMGQVFLAASPAGRMVAIKVIHPELARDPTFIRRFRGEVLAARRVSGMYTAPLVAAGIDEVPPWLATAFVAGPSLDDVITTYGPLPEPALWRLAAGLAEALQAIHAAGLVHRDLKPANVLLASDGPRVIDFGIARAITDTRLTATGSVVGTPSFMSPEQVEDQPIGPASDMFSLGSVLALAASGTSPFSAGPASSCASVMYRVVHGEPELARVAEGVRELIAACLAKDPVRRPDPGQVAMYCATATEQLGLLTPAFWPPDLAQVIAAHEAALSEQLQALQASAAFPASAPAGSPRAALSPSPELAAPGRAASGPSMRAAAALPESFRHLLHQGGRRRELLAGADATAIAVAGAAAGSKALATAASHVTVAPAVGSGIICDGTVSGFDPRRPNDARMYNYLLGGKDHFAADREAMNEGIKSWPSVRVYARENRKFLARAVEYLAREAGIRQFLDIGTGLPSANNVHEVAQRVAPDSRVVYVDNDPLVFVHVEALLTSDPAGRTACIEADLRDPAKILSHPVVLRTLDFSQPIALMLVAILHFIPDEDDAGSIVSTLMSALAPGSYLVSSHVTAELDPDGVHGMERVYRAGGIWAGARSAADFGRFFTGLDLVPPGLVPISEWRPASEEPPLLASEVSCNGAVARKRGL